MRMINLSIFAVVLTLLLPQAGVAKSDGNTHFLDAKVVSDFKQSLPQPPTKDSKGQKEDESEILRLISSRKSADCDRAKTEIEATLENLYGPPFGPLSKIQVERLDGFFKVLRNEAGALIGPLKETFPRQRPYQYMKGVETCIKQETSNSYPSGHATLAELYSNVLSDLFPSKKNEIQARSKVIGQDRVLAGLHHPSDIAAGKSIGHKIYEELLKSKTYKEAFAAAKKTLN